MWRLYDCVANQHDLWRVGAAAIVCALGSYAAFATGSHAAVARDRATRHRWGAISLVTTCCAIWATHFIAMLAYHVPYPSGYLIGPTILSFVVALVVVGAGGVVAIRARSRRASAVAGVLIGLAISAMHFTGMSAFRTVGTITWDWPLVAAAVVIGSACCALAGFSSWHRPAPRVWTPAAFVFIGVCGDHFTAMSAATIVYDPAVALPPGLIEGAALAPLVTFVGMLIVAVTLVGYRVHLQATRRMVAERERFLAFADIAVEGLVIVDGDRIVWANRSLEAIAGAASGAYVGKRLAGLLPQSVIEQLSNDREFDAILGTDAEATPVRVLMKPIELEGRPHRVIAFRDQRERLRAEAEMRRLADSDALTGLANRARFNEVIEQMFSSRRATERRFALLSVDLDHFKHINDAYGHAAGDALLVRVAGRLEAAVRDGSLVARIGGDEFSVVCSGFDRPEAVHALADRIVEVLARPFVIDGRVHEIGASVGVAMAPADGDCAAALVRNADLALYRAKEDGRSVYRLFEAGMDARMQARRGLELALRRATARREFQLFYQPQVDAKSGAYTGAEALIRWMDPQRGIVMPAEFIPIAEETNLIAAIGEWVLHTACAEAATWPAHLNIAVNLSPVQFRDPRLLSIVVAALEESGLAPHRLELEITENVLIQDETSVFALLRSFKRLGVRISLDDFGTGYSSLGHLHRFPFDKIKIDRSFVSRATEDRDSAAIVRAVVSLGASLGISTTAEGVETGEQHRFVRDEGCDQIQGFLFSRPMPASQMPIEFRTTNESTPCLSSASSIAATAS